LDALIVAFCSRNQSNALTNDTPLPAGIVLDMILQGDGASQRSEMRTVLNSCTYTLTD
jgi:hypothetical protein